MKPDSSPNTGSEPSKSASSELGQGVPFPPYSTDSFLPSQTSPLSEALDLIRSLVITEEQCPNYAQPGLGAENGEFYAPPTTHFIVTAEDLTDMLDYGSEDIDGMDDDAREEQAQNPPFTGRWTTTSSYDVYMVDTPKEGNGDNETNPIKDIPPETRPRRRRPRRRSKSRRGKDSNTGTGENNTPDDAEDNEDPVEITSEQEERENGQVSPD